MNVQSDVRELIGEIDKTLQLIEKNRLFHEDFQKRFIETQGRETGFAMTLSQVFCDFTLAWKHCLSAFLRCSRTTWYSTDGTRASSGR